MDKTGNYEAILGLASMQEVSYDPTYTNANPLLGFLFDGDTE